MQDDTTNPVIEEEVVEEQPVQEAPVVEQEEPTQDTPEEEEVREDPEPAQPSRREQLRVQELLRKYGPPQRTAPSNTSAPDFRSRVSADEEVYKDLEDTAKSYGQEQYEAGLKQAEFTTWRRFLQQDESQIRTKYEALNPNNKEQYHPALEKGLQAKYLRSVGYDPGDPERGIAPSVMYPDLSYTDFVESEMEFAEEMAASLVAKTTRNIAKQTSRIGLRPDGSSPKRMDLNKAPEDMTDEELSAAIKSSMPRDNRGRFTSNK